MRPLVEQNLRCLALNEQSLGREKELPGHTCSQQIVEIAMVSHKSSMILMPVIGYIGLHLLVARQIEERRAEEDEPRILVNSGSPIAWGRWLTHCYLEGSGATSTAG